MALTAGTRIGPYEITGTLGAGGMGEVYRARDTRLKREVALKVLPDTFASDSDRLARFQREAELLASLNHPHIAAIHGLEESNGIRALVMELVEGPTLADRIEQGSIPVDEALPIAKQIAEALEAAHEQDIIHRDLKPANVKVRPDGTVKVLDFGLAKALDPGAASPPSANLTNSPTITSPAMMTGVGVLLGTAAYMSPEQARGKAVDKRTDVWAFGCVLYEMLTGKRAFGSEDLSNTLAAVLRDEPDWRLLPADTPAAVRRLLRRCLRKDVKERLHDISDARIEIDEALAAQIDEPGQITRMMLPSAWRRVATHASTALVASAVVGAVVWLALRPVIPPLRVLRFTITPPSVAALTISGSGRDLAITPDGTRVVYVGANGSALFVRALDQLDATRLTGLGAPRGPFLSPDGQWIGFVDGLVLKKVALSGGPAVVLGRIGSGARGASWGSDNTIVLATSDPATGLQQIPAEGGAPTVLTRPNLAGGEADHLWPEFLPDGEAVLFTITTTTGGLDAASVAVLDLRTGTHTILIRAGRHAHYVRSGHLVYAVAGTLRAVPFDLTNRAVIGPPVPVVPEVVMSAYGAADAVVADDGTLVYVPGTGAAAERTLVWVDRQGREEPLMAPVRAYQYPRLSPDGRRVALDVRDQELDIWTWDFIREMPARLTFDPGQDYFPVWTPDGRRLVFSSSRAGVRNLFWQAADGTGTIERLSESPNAQDPSAMSPDATRLVFKEQSPKTGWDLMVLTLDKQRHVEPLVRTTFDEVNAEISPDGRWLAYQSNESGQNEVYVRPFPDVNGGRWQISTGGGRQPVWARSGEELFYLAPSGTLIVVRIGRATSFTPGVVTKLFEGRRYHVTSGGALGRHYDVSLDGRRFLMIKPEGGSDQTAASPIFIVVQNWAEELKRLVPTE
jgi:serine/threonine-protein kinase